MSLHTDSDLQHVKISTDSNSGERECWILRQVIWCRTTRKGGKVGKKKNNWHMAWPRNSTGARVCAHYCKGILWSHCFQNRTKKQSDQSLYPPTYNLSLRSQKYTFLLSLFLSRGSSGTDWRQNIMFERCIYSTPFNQWCGSQRWTFVLLWWQTCSADGKGDPAGRYKCGSCGCESHMMDNIAYIFRCKCRSLSDLQSIALAGKYGKQRGVVRPFIQMTSEQLQQELRTWNMFRTHNRKGDLQQELSRVLKGVQRVPTLLLQNPSQHKLWVISTWIVIRSLTVNPCTT